MTQCRTFTEFNKIASLKPDELDALSINYDQDVRAHPECANADHYLLLSNAFFRAKKETPSDVTLGKAFWASMGLWQTDDAINLHFIKSWTAGQHDRESVIQKIRTQQAAADWKTVTCAKNLPDCRNMGKEATAFYNQLRNYLLRYLYARLFTITATPLEVGYWVSDPITLGAWKKSPDLVVEVMNEFITTQKIEPGSDIWGGIGNALLVLRDLLEMTAKADRGGLVHLPSPKVFSKYYAPSKQLLPHVGQGVAIYLIFIQQVSDIALPDKAMISTLTEMSDNKRVAIEVEKLVQERIQKLKDRK